jgi:hypothetical protein
VIFLDRFEQRCTVAFPESVITLALDEFEEDRPARVGGKYLQQHLGVAAFAVVGAVFLRKMTEIEGDSAFELPD